MFDIKMPTPEEMHEVCSRKYAAAEHTYIDNWPKEWAALTVATKMIPIGKPHVDEIFGAHDGLRSFPALSDLAREIDDACNWKARFIRLNTRSPKDVTDSPITCAGRQALSWIMSSERTMDDLSMLEHARKPAFVALRDVAFFRREDELRCFVKGGELIAVCQYHYTEPQRTWQDKTHRDEAWQIIEAYWRDLVQPPSPLHTYVFDVALRHNDRPLLIEVNPYGLSDPCAAESYAAVERGGFFFVAPRQGDRTTSQPAVGEPEP